MKKVTVTTTDGKQYVLTFNRKTAAMFGDMGYRVGDITNDGKAFTAVPVFVWCALKANHPTIRKDKAEEVWDALSLKSKSKVLDALVDMYAATYTELMGSENDEDDEGNASVEFEE